MNVLDQLREWFRWPPGRIFKSVLVVALLAVVGVVVALLRPVVIPPDHPGCGKGGSGVSKYGPDHECVGVTDGSYDYAPAYLREVTDRIRAENRAVTKSTHPYATVALMIPMVSSSASEQRQIREEVQGAYLAQWRANRKDNSEAPAIRLVLANPGRAYTQWRPVVAKLAAMSRSGRDNLRVVAGFNLSVADTADAMSALANTYGIPLVGGPLTADDFTNTPQQPRRFTNLVRVAPTNSDEANALVHFMPRDPNGSLIVEDTRPRDNYIQTLREAFERQAPNAHVEQFQSPDDINDPGNISNVFDGKLANICAAKAHVIYFAGRPVQLRQFVNALANGACDTPYTVVSGSNASVLVGDGELDWDKLKKSGITVEYAALGYPDEWKGRTPAPGGSQDDYAEFAQAVQAAGHAIGEIGLTDERTITQYDTVWTAVREIRTATGANVRIPRLPEVGHSRDNMHGTTPVRGASGWICLDNYGNAYDKAVAVVRLDPAAHATRLVGIAWPTGGPPPADCTAPRGT
ncbi:ABC transporter substrate-binding protein [Streptomyces polygonati]|uniref:ABC transporter substrate-binding protein n=1 Tax=Streptomyces polygonati TaxID=1617087 RepID=A0ABV8HSL9_9ACTN